MKRAFVFGEDVSIRLSFRQACGNFILTSISIQDVTRLEFIQEQIKKGCTVKNIALISRTWSDSGLRILKDLGCKVFQTPITVDEINAWIDVCEEKMRPVRVFS